MRSRGLIIIAGCLAVSAGWASSRHLPSQEKTADAPYVTYCAEEETSLPAGSSARWEAGTTRLVFAATRPEAPVVVIEGADHEAVEFLVEAVAYVAGARIELDEQIHSVAIYGRARVPIDLSPAIGLHPAQASVPTLIRVRATVLEEDGRRSSRMIALPDLVMSTARSGAMKLRGGTIARSEIHDGRSQDVVDSLDTTVLREMERSARAKRLARGKH